MTNPLGVGASAPLNAPFAGMLEGETRVHAFKDGSTIAITRTNRPFVFDWCDARNQELAAKRSKYRWVPELLGDDRHTASLKSLSWIEREAARRQHRVEPMRRRAVAELTE